MRLGWMWATVLLCACSSPAEQSGGKSADKPRETSTGKATGSAPASGVATGSAAPSPKAPMLPALPSPIPKGPTHYAASSPPAANGACKPLPKAGPAALAPLAKALRRLSCEPALYFMTNDELQKELALPAGHKAAFVGPSAVSIDYPKGKAVDLAAALGVTSAVARRRNKGAWGWRMWDMATDEKTGELELWSPGKVAISLRVDDVGLDDKVNSIPLEKAELSGYVAASMPESVLPIVDDEVALAMLLVGLDKIAKDKKRLSEEPAELAKLVGLDNDRFRLSRRSIGTGPDQIKGIDVWTARTRVAAGPVIEGLGLSGKIEHSRAHDSDEHLLFQGDSNDFSWREMKIELAFDKRAGAAASGRHGEWTLDRVTLMP